MKYSKSDLRRLSTTRGVVYLLADDPPRFDEVSRRLRYVDKLRTLQVKLIHMQNWVVGENARVLIIVEGGEFAGKGGTISVATEHLNPRSARIVALPRPSKVEEGQWYFQRYVMQLPKPGEIVFFDRSWYNRAVVEPVNGFCTKKQYKQFMGMVNDYERMLHLDGMLVIKLYLSISKKVQAERIQNVRNNPLRRWELTKVDENAQKLWSKYKSYSQEMLDKTNTADCPWIVVDANDKRAAHLSAIQHILDKVPYQTD